jgi:membrane protease YdiL (CAAX protease family)
MFSFHTSKPPLLPSKKELQYFVVGVLVFYTLWTLRSYLGYELFGYENLSETDQIHRIYNSITKFCWLILAVGLLRYYFKKDWAKTSGLFSFNLKAWPFHLFSLVSLGSIMVMIVEAPAKFWTHFTTNFNWNQALGLMPSVLYEEVLFRGFLLPYLFRYMNFWKANIIQALLFVFVHYCWWVFAPAPDGGITLDDSLYIFGLGIIWGYTRYKTGSIYSTIFAHFVHNVLLTF